MSNNNGIERREVTTPFEMMQSDNNDVLELEDVPTPPVEDIVEPIVNEETPIVEPIIEEPAVKPTDDPSEEDEVEYDVKIKANLAKYAAENLKSEGGLPDDFEIKDDITEEEINKAYVSYKSDVLRNDIRKEELAKLQEEGLTPQMIEEVKLRHFGTQDSELQELQVLKQLSTYEFNEEDDLFGDDAQAFLTTYYGLKGIPQSRIASIVERDLEDEGISELLQTAQKDLHSGYITLDGSIKQRAKLEQENRVKAKEASLAKVNTLLDSKVINNVTYTPAELEVVRKALFDKTEIITGPDGNKYRATLYYKKRMEAANDLEKDLANKINFILGGDSTALKNKERAKATKKLMKGLNDFIDVDVKKPKRTNNKHNSTSFSVDNSDGIERREVI